ncbi:4'-phosphopantetheinyl transferase family protein [Streptomyces canus]|uniref:4'-phosphopantetheinyl transferase family protein n=1 Tax=Streptomyces canus TaxID=58343 RepID=UPI00368F5022
MHITLRQLLGACLGIEPHRVRPVQEPCQLCRGPHGRPVVDGVDGMHLSISHSRDIGLIELATRWLGVDVEAVPSPETVAEIAPLLHPEEEKAVASAAAAEERQLLARVWVRKEACLKGVGIGLAWPLSADSVGAGLEPADDLPGWAIEDVPLPGEYAAAVTYGWELLSG